MHMLIPAIGDPHDGGERHQGTRAPRPHAGHRAAKHAHHALEVDIQRMIPQGVGHRLQRHTMRDPGIGDDGVDAAQLRLGMGEDGVDRVGILHIQRMEAGAATGGRDLGHHRLAFRRQHIGDEHMRAQAPKSQGGGSPDANPRTRDQNRLCHSITSPEFGHSVWPT